MVGIIRDHNRGCESRRAGLGHCEGTARDEKGRARVPRGVLEKGAGEGCDRSLQQLIKLSPAA